MSEFEPIVVDADIAVLDEAVNARVKTEIVVPSDITIEPLTATENGAYTAPTMTAYSPVNVNVPQTDVQPLEVIENGNYEAPDGTAYNPVMVAVPIKTEESLTVEQNGTYTPETGKVYNRVVASVPNTYTVQDDGKVVSNGALVAQTARTVAQNGTIDTTLNNSVTVDVSVQINGKVFACGSFTPDSNITTGQVITHNLNIVPSAAFLWTANPSYATRGMLGKARFDDSTEVNSCSMMAANGGLAVGAGATTSNFRISWDSTTVTFNSSALYPLLAGVTYQWLIIA